VFDAWALGLEVVTTEEPPGSTGWAIAVPRRDPEAIARELAALAATPDRRRRFSEASRARASALADDLPDRLADFRELYRATLERQERD
jgi:hypothetical protein